MFGAMAVHTHMELIRCDPSFSDQILSIVNDAILNSTALYDYQSRPLDSMKIWFEAQKKGQCPLIVVVNKAGELMGFGSYGTFRAWPAYKYSVEHSIYVE